MNAQSLEGNRLYPVPRKLIIWPNMMKLAARMNVGDIIVVAILRGGRSRLSLVDIKKRDEEDELNHERCPEEDSVNMATP